jgi:uncharacterized protein DUF4352
MPDETAYELPVGSPYPHVFDGPRPAMAAHWPAPPGGWLQDEDGGASTKPDLRKSDEENDDLRWADPTDISTDQTPPDLTPPDLIPPDPTPPSSAVPERSRPKHLPLILSIVAGFVGLGLIAGVTLATVSGVRTYRQHRQQITVGMDQPVRDGAFQFTADGMQCGVHEIGPPDDYQAPTGQFCVITLTIKNVGTNPAIFADAIQKAYGTGGVWFGSDSEAAFYANPDPDIFFNDINPGNTVRALVVYDIPQSGHIVRLEVHENPTTRGAIIKIG